MTVVQSWQRFRALEELMADNALPESPVVIPIVVSLAEDVSRERMVEIFVNRLLTHPRFASRLVKRNGKHLFEPIPGFTTQVAAEHVIEEPVDRGLPHSQQLKLFNERVAQLMSTHMEKEKPLWRAHLFRKWSIVEENEQGCTIVLRVHHSISDGIGLVKFFTAAIVDEGKPDMLVIPHRQKERSAPRQEPLVNVANSSIVQRALWGLQDLYNATVGLLFPDPVTTLTKGKMSGRKVFALVPPGKFSVQRLKDASRAWGVTINDLLYAALTGALAKYLQACGDDVDEVKKIRCAIPINRHMLEAFVPEDVANEVALLALHMDVRQQSAEDRMRNSSLLLQVVKRGFRPELTMLMLEVVARLPRIVRNPLWKQLTKSSSLIFTNVPGPRQCVRVGGVAITGAYFFAPTDGNCSLVMSLFSYNGEVCIGVSADDGRIREPQLLADAVEAEIEELIEMSTRRT